MLLSPIKEILQYGYTFNTVTLQTLLVLTRFARAGGRQYMDYFTWSLG
jgi:hypothetical protein